MISNGIVLLIMKILSLLFTPVHVVLLSLFVYLAYNLFKIRNAQKHFRANFIMEIDLPYISRNLTMRELRKFDGYQPDARILVALNGYIFDVSKAYSIYGPGGAWARFAGRDMTRCFARPTDFEYMDPLLEFDDLSDLSYKEMKAVRKEELNLRLEFPLVGKVLRDDVQKCAADCSWEATYVDDDDEQFPFNKEFWKHTKE